MELLVHDVATFGGLLGGLCVLVDIASCPPMCMLLSNVLFVASFGVPLGLAVTLLIGKLIF